MAALFAPAPGFKEPTRPTDPVEGIWDLTWGDEFYPRTSFKDGKCQSGPWKGTYSYDKNTNEVFVVESRDGGTSFCRWSFRLEPDYRCKGVFLGREITVRLAKPKPTD